MAEGSFFVWVEIKKHLPWRVWSGIIQVKSVWIDSIEGESKVIRNIFLSRSWGGIRR